MQAAALRLDSVEAGAHAPVRRFDRVAITSTRRTKPGRREARHASQSLADALMRLGLAVQPIEPALDAIQMCALALGQARRGRFGISPRLLGGAAARRYRARVVARVLARSGIRDAIHTDTLDLPACDLLENIRHYLYCDHGLPALAAERDRSRLSERRGGANRRLERESLTRLEHIFASGIEVRDDLVARYGILPKNITVVGPERGLSSVATDEAWDLIAQRITYA